MHVGDWHVGVERCGHRLHRGHDGRGRRRGPRDVIAHHRHRLLPEGEVHLLRGGFRQRSRPHMLHHAHHLDPVLERTGLFAVRSERHLYLLADGALVRPGVSRQRLVDDHHEWTVRVVPIGEVAPGHERRAHGAEIPGRVEARVQGKAAPIPLRRIVESVEPGHPIAGEQGAILQGVAALEEDLCT